MKWILLLEGCVAQPSFWPWRWMGVCGDRHPLEPPSRASSPCGSLDCHGSPLKEQHKTKAFQNRDKQCRSWGTLLPTLGEAPTAAHSWGSWRTSPLGLELARAHHRFSEIESFSGLVLLAYTMIWNPINPKVTGHFSSQNSTDRAQDLSKIRNLKVPD